MNRLVCSVIPLLLATLLAGCGQQTAPHPDLEPLRAKYLLASEPAGAKDILQSRAMLDEQTKKSESPAPAAASAEADAAKDDYDHDEAHDHDADHDHAHDDRDHAHADHDHGHHDHEAHEGVKIVVVGKIGGVDNPWDKGRAAFMLVDASSAPAAHDEHDTHAHADEGHAHDAAEHDEAHAHHDHAHSEHEDCPFCERAKAGTKSLAIVQFVAEDGKTVSIDTRQLFGVDMHQTVVVRGRATLDALGNMVITADGLYIRQ